MDQVMIDRLRDVTPSLENPHGLGKKDDVGGSRFAELVSGLVDEVNTKQNEASANAEGLAKGEVGIMETVVSLNEADLSLRMMMQIRDRALDAYQRILRTI
ncbi:MAG: flagellar hook-basal body complex protein FliE [Deltaproteobacteria bacterium]|nr:flagellar hook-basal body complex protein FliE [Deltaproteobacteria bacterium]